jgi:16S rRNA (guanine966-N2)-methyltransferase
MKLRIVAGSLKGRMLGFSPNDALFRPTLERARRSVADTLQPYLRGAIAADLCAGSGAFGFEMVSRGAAHVDFVERDRRRAEAIRKAAEQFGVEEQCEVFAQEVNDFARQCTRRYDIIFYDPPYNDHALGETTLPARLLSPGGILVFQRGKKRGMKGGGEESEPPFDTRNFGDTIVEFYRFSKAKNE